MGSQLHLIRYLRNDLNLLKLPCVNWLELVVRYARRFTYTLFMYGLNEDIRILFNNSSVSRIIYGTIAFKLLNHYVVRV